MAQAALAQGVGRELPKHSSWLGILEGQHALPMGLIPPLPPRFSSLPGAFQRRRALAVLAVAALVVALRPLWPFYALPGWVVGALLLWAIAELVRWAWWPRRST
jgi:hypothetical protein